VVDASAFIDYLLYPSGLAIAPTIERAGADLNVPELCDVEVSAGLRRAVRRREISQQRALLALGHYLDLTLVRHPHASLLSRAFALGTFTVYDAVYVSLAERLGVALLTTDRRLARAVASTRGIDVTLA